MRPDLTSTPPLEVLHPIYWLYSRTPPPPPTGPPPVSHATGPLPDPDRVHSHVTAASPVAHDSGHNAHWDHRLKLANSIDVDKCLYMPHAHCGTYSVGARDMPSGKSCGLRVLMHKAAHMGWNAKKLWVH